MLQSYLNRVVAVLSVVSGLAAALLPVVANLDLTSTVGLVTGAIAIQTTVVTWLVGWQKHEARVADPLDTGPGAKVLGSAE